MRLSRVDIVSFDNSISGSKGDAGCGFFSGLRKRINPIGAGEYGGDSQMSAHCLRVIHPLHLPFKRRRAIQTDRQNNHHSKVVAVVT
jgi:hypothetical protein